MTGNYNWPWWSSGLKTVYYMRFKATKKYRSTKVSDMNTLVDSL